jgi:hypothetical protein
LTPASRDEPGVQRSSDFRRFIARASNAPPRRARHRFCSKASLSIMPGVVMSIHRHARAAGPRRTWPRLANAIVAGVIAAFSTYGVAQITNGGGAGSQEQRQSDSSSRAEPSGAPMHESQKPQSKDAAQGRAATGGKNQKSEGNTGFNNGLYGTGAGNNK